MKNNNYRQAIVSYKKEAAGILEEIDKGYKFTYNNNFIKKGMSISVSLPINKQEYTSNLLFPFFIGLLPEGWYLELICSTLKIDSNDTFGILLATCEDTIGAVSIKAIK